MKQTVIAKMIADLALVILVHIKILLASGFKASKVMAAVPALPQVTCRATPDPVNTSGNPNISGERGL